MIEAIRAFQQEINSIGGQSAIAEDGILGPATAVAYADCLRRGVQLPPDVVDAARAECRAVVPHVTNAEAVYGPPPGSYWDDPRQRGACVFTPAGRVWANVLRTATLPGGHRVTLHKRVLPLAICAFADILALRLEYELTDVQSYCLRRQLWTPGKPLSDHARGCALDLNPDTNLYGTRGDIPDAILECLAGWGFLDVGARWDTPDPMHVAACRRGVE